MRHLLLIALSACTTGTAPRPLERGLPLSLCEELGDSAAPRCEADPASCFSVGCVDQLGNFSGGIDMVPCETPAAYAKVDWQALDEAAARCDPGFNVSPYDGICINDEPDEWRFLVACAPLSGPA